MNRVIWWLRNDLRLKDNPALRFAVEQGVVIPVYILDEQQVRSMGAASKCWLHHSLRQLDTAMQGRLQLFKGDPQSILESLVREADADCVVWNRLYEPDTIARDSMVKQALQSLEIKVKSFNANHLWQPQDILKKDGTPYKVFTPYYRRGCLNATTPRYPLPAPEAIQWYKVDCAGRMPLDDFVFLPSIPWDKTMMSYWQPGESGASDKLQRYIQDAMPAYKEQRNIPSVKGTSQLSPHLHFGEISPNQVWYAIQDGATSQGLSPDNADVDCYLSELGWREFSAYLLFHFPQITTQNFNVKFDGFPWRTDDTVLQRWQTGQTGFPIVDAGMRELWHTGYMHNRVRMIVGSFLVKNLLLHWHNGEHWFWDTLVDADYASNVASWQWIAGSGADAAPYFRIFNPVTQGQKFDPHGEYVKTWCPELTSLPDKFIHNPWEAPLAVLNSVGVTLGEHYPTPVVDLKASRQRALDAFSAMKAHNLQAY